MSEQEFVLAIIAITISCGVIIVGIVKITDLIKSWLNRNNSSIPEESFNRLAKAFMEYKKGTERRLKNLEAIISEEHSESKSELQKASKQIEAPKESIEIEERETTEEESQSDNDTNLRNMLRE